VDISSFSQSAFTRKRLRGNGGTKGRGGGILITTEESLPPEGEGNKKIELNSRQAGQIILLLQGKKGKGKSSSLICRAEHGRIFGIEEGESHQEKKDTSVLEKGGGRAEPGGTGTTYFLTGEKKSPTLQPTARRIMSPGKKGTVDFRGKRENHRQWYRIKGEKISNKEPLPLKRGRVSKFWSLNKEESVHEEENAYPGL